MEFYSRLMSKPLIPFHWLPASWGLRGSARDEAQAHYELEGYDLEVRLAEIKYEGDDLKKKLLRIDYAHGLISDYDFEVALANLELRGNDLAKALIEIDHGHGLISEDDKVRALLPLTLDGVELAVELIKLDIETGQVDRFKGEKEIADLLKEPWVAIIKEGLDITAGPNGFYFEFDWNENWIDMLRAHGYEGTTDEELMEKWFTDVCRNEVVQSQPLPFNSSVIYE